MKSRRSWSRNNKPKIEKNMANGDLRCQTLVKKGRRKPGVWKQCRKTVASNKRKYCKQHTSKSLYMPFSREDKL